MSSVSRTAATIDDLYRVDGKAELIRPTNEMRFVKGPPTFAVEVRSENDYGDAAEEEMAAKRADYFEAGTQVVWDVDPRQEHIRKFTADSPDQPAVFTRGREADAEPALPGWRVAVEQIFD